jgi:hypothetical protein
VASETKKGACWQKRRLSSLRLVDVWVENKWEAGGRLMLSALWHTLWLTLALRCIPERDPSTWGATWRRPLNLRDYGRRSPPPPPPSSWCSLAGLWPHGGSSSKFRRPDPLALSRLLSRQHTHWTRSTSISVCRGREVRWTRCGDARMHLHSTFNNWIPRRRCKKLQSPGPRRTLSTQIAADAVSFNMFICIF